MSEKWTKGPWQASGFLVVGGDRLSDRICHVGTSTSLPPSRSHESEANAHLIAAAPDLYEALSNALAAGLPDIVAASARRALSRARGE